jgi:hypothetical protein
VASSIAPSLSAFTASRRATLDIRLLNGSSRESTLYTVLSDGTIDYPLAGEPIKRTA